MSAFTLADAVKYGFRGAHLDEDWINPFLDAVSAASFESAIWKPGADVPCIWEIVAHSLPYIEVLHADLTGGNVEKADDWPEVSAPTEGEWAATQERFRAAVLGAQAAIDGLDDDGLVATAPGRRKPNAQRIMDLAIHGAYHAGQVIKLEQTYRAAEERVAGAVIRT